MSVSGGNLDLLIGAGIPISLVPEYIRKSNFLQEILENPRFTPPSDEASIRAWLMKMHAHVYAGSNEDDEALADSLVDDLGGEKEAKAWIETCRSSVRISSTQLRMMDLMKKTGFSVESISSGGAYTFLRRTSIGEVTDAGDNGTAAGGTNTLASSGTVGAGGAIGGGRGGGGRGADGLGRDGGGNSRRGGKGQQSKPDGFGASLGSGDFHFNILVVNQRDDDLADTKHKKDYLIVKVHKNSTVKHMKQQVNHAWGIELSKQFFWMSDKKSTHFVNEEMFGMLTLTKSARLGKNPTRLSLEDEQKLKGVLRKDSTLLLRHGTKKMTLRTNGGEANLSPWWPTEIMCRRLSQIPLPIVFSEEEDLPDDTGKKDPKFSPEFAMAIRPVYCPGWFLSSPCEVIVIFEFLFFGVDRMCDCLDYRGYFVEKCELCFQSIVAENKFMASTAHFERTVHLQTGKIESLTKGFKGLLGFGGTDIRASGEAGVEVRREGSNAASSDLKSVWAVEDKKTGWVFNRDYWESFDGDPKEVTKYPAFDQKTETLPPVSKTFKTNACAFHGIMLLGKPLMSLPSLRTLITKWQSNGEKEDRDDKATLKTNVTMTLRKLDVSPLCRRQRIHSIMDYSDSYRDVTIEGNVRLAEFPKSVYGFLNACKVLMLYLCAIYVIVVVLSRGTTIAENVLPLVSKFWVGSGSGEL